MEYSVQFQKLCQIEARKYVLVLSVVAIIYLMLQTFMLPYGIALKSLLPDNDVFLSVRNGFTTSQLSVKSENEGVIYPSNLIGLVKQDDQSKADEFSESNNSSKEIGRITQDIVASEKGKYQIVRLSGLNTVNDAGKNSSRVKSDIAGNNDEIVGQPQQVLQDSILELNASSGFDQTENLEGLNKANVIQPRKKKVRPGMPPISVTPIDKMNRILTRHFAASTKLKPQWSSLHDRDKEIIDAKLKIINSSVPGIDKELYAPLFRNVSMFMRSYELMERTLKVYVYKDGKKPIFHQPILKGLYASEGWFMKLMEGNKHFAVKNPEKAHLFYMPFSSRNLEYALYEPSSHNRTKLREFVKNYTQTIAAKYPFWNRTGGTDHFVVACHDWAPYETRHHMENSIKALCNADVTIGFKIGRDVSLPETFVRYARNPLRDIGGKPPSKRNILAFYAGNSHGYLRPILLKHWKDKDPDMRIYGLLPNTVSRRMNYIQHMKSSKYCICPKGHEVNSPRVVEAIFYDCVPVIISDNFVPPFFEVLNWEAFSVIVAEKDIPNLKNILVSIPKEKYIEMQFAVRMVQRHFLWHARPMKYDLFHMILHSIWYSRVFQIQR
ncbi:hypothetical protein RDABS01_034478 [Bienertia sinuspersici]